MENELWKNKCIEKLRGNPEIDDSVIKFVKSSNAKYIVGQSRQAAVCLEIARNFKIKIDGLLVLEEFHDETERKGYWKALIDDMQVYTPRQLREKGKSIDVLMPVGEKNYSECERNRSLLNQADLAILKLPTRPLRVSSPECRPFLLLQNQFQKVFLFLLCPLMVLLQPDN